MKNSVRCVFIWLALAVCAAAQYKQALPGYTYQFPRDHFNHPDYRTEWWYYTGNLKSADGHRFGFELTFFRQGASREPLRNVNWGMQDLYLAHFALSDLDAQRVPLHRARESSRPRNCRDQPAGRDACGMATGKRNG